MKMVVMYVSTGCQMKSANYYTARGDIEDHDE